jgi:hypothetical protein
VEAPGHDLHPVAERYRGQAEQVDPEDAAHTVEQLTGLLEGELPGTLAGSPLEAPRSTSKTISKSSTARASTLLDAIRS